MGAIDHDPFAEDAPPALALPSDEVLHDMADLLRLVHYWRTKYEALEDEKQFRIARWRAERKR